MSEPTPTPKRLSLKLQAPLARVKLSHPPRNVIDLAMMDELASAWRDIEARPDIALVIFEGEGDCFSSGVDVAAHTPERIEAMLEKFHGVVRSLVLSEKITLARVHGYCLGGGAELAMICDLVVTADDARWGFPEITLACYPPVAVTALAALIGPKPAADLIFSGRTISGFEACRLGLATEAVRAQDLDSSVGERIARLKELSGQALAMAKKSLYAWDSIHFEKGLARAEKIYREELMNTEDAHEGIQAFLEKRKPRWTGKPCAANRRI
jgi:cyclohexa-1,5-dienecarbonyl-CoA hydratase